MYTNTDQLVSSLHTKLFVIYTKCITFSENIQQFITPLFLSCGLNVILTAKFNFNVLGKSTLEKLFGPKRQEVTRR
jgi:hypothetical protein